jgi:hypothetical protein
MKLSELLAEKDRIELKVLGRELKTLEARAIFPHASVFGLLEQFGYISRHKEHLHSRLIEFFLTPGERHGLGDALLKGFAQKASGRFFSRGSPCGDPELNDLADTKVEREWPADDLGRADLFAKNERLQFAIVMENKVRQAERIDQLKDYWEAAARLNPDFAIAGLFITPDGRPPQSAGGYPYVSVSFAEISELLDKLAAEADRKDEFGPSTSALAEQYAHALKRWFVEDPELKQMAWRLHQLYPNALEYLQRVDVKPVGQIVEKLRDLISSDERFKCLEPFIGPQRLGVSFVAKKWEEVGGLKNGATIQDRRIGERLLYFVFGGGGGDEDLVLYLSLGAGKRSENSKAIFEAIRRTGLQTLGADFVHSEVQEGHETNVWAKRFASAGQLRDPEPDSLFSLIEEHWKDFCTNELTTITKAVGGLPFFQDS